jgi:hypothetical protein
MFSLCTLGLHCRYRIIQLIIQASLLRAVAVPVAIACTRTTHTKDNQLPSRERQRGVQSESEPELDPT